MLATVILLAFILLFIILFYFSIKKALKIIKTAINVSCFIETYHWDKDDWERLEIGFKKFHKEIWENKSETFMEEETNFVFLKLYEKIFFPLLKTIPVEILKYRHRALKDGEETKSERIIDSYHNSQKLLYKGYECQCAHCNCKEENEKSDGVTK